LEERFTFEGSSSEIRRSLRALAIMTRTALIAAIATSTALADQAEEIATARHAVAATLRDPASARFEDVRARLGAVCGFVNAKNGPGGYAGRRDRGL